MIEDVNREIPNTDDDNRFAMKDYLARAQTACDEGDSALGMYLYLAAFEEAANASAVPSEDALFGLKQAWVLACTSKERSMAEYIFEKMEPYLNADEVAICTDELQDMALGHLEEIGLSREDLEDVAEMITQDIFGLDAPQLKIESITENGRGLPGLGGSAPTFTVTATAHVSEEAAAKLQEASASSTEEATDSEAEGASTMLARASAAVEAAGPQDFTPLSDKDFNTVVDGFDYDTVTGYQTVIETMRDFGIGVKDDEGFRELVDLLNVRHGLTSMPAIDSLLFRAPAREDANRFIAATLGEIGLPVLRMRMEENLQGMPVLCVTAQSADMPRAGSLKALFDKGGVLVLEDLDLWSSPLMDAGEDANGFLMMQLSRGAHEAINLIRYAAENPNVYVLASAGAPRKDGDGVPSLVEMSADYAPGSIDPFFLELLEPLSIVDIENPTPEERVDIWLDIARAHPSLRSINRADLVRFSANMPRFDIYMAVREAIEESYKFGLMTRRYCPVTRENLFDKLAAYQPLESSEYKELEDEVIRDFRMEIDRLEDIL